MSGALLSVRDLRTTFRTEAGDVTAVDGVSFDVFPGEVLGIVGESGSGKTAAALSVLGLVPEAQVAATAVCWKGRDLMAMPAELRRRIRGAEISMVFQDPMTSLNPVYRVGDQIADVVRAHQSLSKAQARERAIAALSRVGIPNPRQRADDYPHQLSGGMRQRALIAMAIVNEPDLIIADEPTTALDMTIQAQVLEVLQEAAATTRASVVLITHDLGVVAGLVNRILVMYAGQIVEEAPVEALYYGSRLPYSWGLMESIARLDQRRGRLRPIAGQPPSPLSPPPGCRFHPRCPYRDEHRCAGEMPALVEVSGDHRARCHFAGEPGWLSPAERATEPQAAWHPRVVARERQPAP